MVEEVEVTVISEDVLEVTGVGIAVEESLDEDSVDVVLVVCSLVEVLETTAGVEEEELLELELTRVEVLAVELEETASHFPNPG